MLRGVLAPIKVLTAYAQPYYYMDNMGGELLALERGSRVRRSFASLTAIALAAATLAGCNLLPKRESETPPPPKETTKTAPLRTLPEGKRQLVVLPGALVPICLNFAVIEPPGYPQELLQNPVTADGTLYYTSRISLLNNQVEYTPLPKYTKVTFYDMEGRPTDKPDCKERPHNGVFRVQGIDQKLVATSRPDVVGSNVYGEPTPQMMHNCGAINYAHPMSPFGVSPMLEGLKTGDAQGPCK